jgi:hypothetical protein
MWKIVSEVYVAGHSSIFKLSSIAAPESKNPFMHVN